MKKDTSHRMSGAARGNADATRFWGDVQVSHATPAGRPNLKLSRLEASVEVREAPSTDTVGLSRWTWGDESVTGSTGMSQVEGFSISSDIPATQPFTALADPPRDGSDPEAADEAAAQQDSRGTRTQEPDTSARDTRWPRWPASWPDGSLPSRSARAGQ